MIKKKKLPSAPDIETRIVSLAFNFPELIPDIFSILEIKDFYDINCSYIIVAIKSLFENSFSIDLLTIKNELGSDISEVSEEFLNDISKYKDKSSLDTYLKIVKEKATHREYINSFSGLVADSYNEKLSPQELIEESTSKLISVSKKIIKKHEHIITKDNIEKERYKGIAERIDRVSSMGGYPKTGFPIMDDKLTYGFLRGGLPSIISGRTRHAKSTFKLNVMNNLSESGYSVASFCLEQDFYAEMNRLQSMRTGIPLKEIANIHTWDEKDKRLKIISDDISAISKRGNLIFFDKKAYSLQDIYLELLKVKQRYGDIDVVFIDLFDRIRDVQTSTNKAQKVTMCLNELINMGSKGELDTHFCLVVQINRGVESSNRKDKHPEIYDLKESGGFEENADMIFLLYREDLYRKDELPDNIVEIKLGKQKEGIDGFTCKYDFDTDIYKFYELE